MRKIVGVSIVISATFANLANYNFHYQDYLDFGQNRGKFKAGATNITINDKTGISHPLGVRMPNLVGITESQYGTSTLVERNYVFTATHVEVRNFTDNGAYYKVVDHLGIALGDGDTSFHRLDKFVTGFVAPEGFLKDPSTIQNGRYTHAFRSGKGVAKYRKQNGELVDITTNPYYIRTGGQMDATSLRLDSKKIYIRENNIFLGNTPTAGDSGSPLLIFDSQNNRWIVAGAVSTGDQNHFAHYAKFDENILNELKKQYDTTPLNLNGKQVQWNGSLSGQSYTDKDLFLQGGGTITLTQNINQGKGGIIFDKNQSYTLTSSNTSQAFSWKGAGVDIPEGTTVIWDINSANGDTLHKIGKGTLKVIRSQFDNFGSLNLGEGTVILSVFQRIPHPAFPDRPEFAIAQTTFRSIIIGSGRGKIIIDKEGALREDYLFFTRDGGTLDVNGKNTTFNYILASDNGANIINSSPHQANLTIKMNTAGLGGVDGNVFKNLFIYHGNIGDNIHIHKDSFGAPQTSKNPHPTITENLLVFDGNIINPRGKITHQNGNLTLQGHPLIHSFVTEEEAKIIKEKTGESVYTSPTKLDQEDWEQRLFILDQINLSSPKESASLVLGRNAILLSNINANQTKIYFGGKKEVYIDKYDGSNVQTQESANSASAKFYQEVQKGPSQKDDSFYFEGNITGSNNTHLYISNTSANPLRFGSFMGYNKSQVAHDFSTFATPPTHQVEYTLKLDSTSSLQAKYVELWGKGNDVILDFSYQPSSASLTSSSPTLENMEHKNIITHLSLKADKTSLIKGDLRIAPTTATELLDTTTSPSITSAITFSSLDSKMKVDGNLNLSRETRLLYESGLSIFDLTYNTEYPLIITTQKISDERDEGNRDIIFLKQPLLESDFPIQTYHKNNEIGLIVRKTASIPPSFHHQ